MNKKRKFRNFTKDEIATVLDLWEHKTIEQIALELARDKSSISYIATEIRKAGYNLPRKRSRGFLRHLIKEVLQDKKLIK